MRLLCMVIITLCLTACASHGVSDTPSSDDTVATLNLNIAMDYLQRGNLLQARQHLRLAKDDNPNDALVWCGIGLYDEKVHDGQAAVAFEHALQLQPRNAMVLNNVAAYQCRHRHYVQAMLLFKQAASDPLYLYIGQVYENMGVCALLAKHSLQAKQYFAKAVAVNPALPFSQRMLSS